MRLKLLIIASLLAALVGAGSAIALILLVFSSLEPITTPGLLVLASYLLPLLTTLLAAMFVYRHTARRRKLQAALTVLLTILLAVTLFLVASIYTSRPAPLNPEPGLQRNAG